MIMRNIKYKCDMFKFLILKCSFNLLYQNKVKISQKSEKSLFNFEGFLLFQIPEYFSVSISFYIRN